MGSASLSCTTGPEGPALSSLTFPCTWAFFRDRALFSQLSSSSVGAGLAAASSAAGFVPDGGWLAGLGCLAAVRLDGTFKGDAVEIPLAESLVGDRGSKSMKSSSFSPSQSAPFLLLRRGLLVGGVAGLDL